MAEKIWNTPEQLARLKLTPAQGAKIYAKLREDVIGAGMLKRSYFYYGLLVTFAFSGFLFSIYNIYIQTTTPQLFFWAVSLVFFTIQLGGLMHDCGHRSVFSSSKWNDVLGHLSCAFLAVRFRNWRPQHNKHHAHPNQEDEDPDVAIPFAFTEDRYKGAKGLYGFIRKYQVYMYFLFGAIVAFTFRTGGMRGFLRTLRFSRLPEFFVVFLGLSLWFVVPFFIFDLSKALLLFFTVHPMLGLYLMTIFAPNHKGMVQFGKDVKVAYIEQQILSSRNIHGGLVTDFLYLGLNYQIEHHLFPNCPRNKLHKIAPYVLKLCKKHGLSYTSVGVFHSNKIILQELHHISQLDQKRKEQSAKRKINEILINTP